MIVPTDPHQPWSPGFLDMGPLKPVAGAKQKLESPAPRVSVNHDCVWLMGYPVCSGSGVGSDGDCLCDNLIGAQHEIAEHNAGFAARERRGEMCADCLFRSEDGNDFNSRTEMAASPGPFFCHVFVPLNAVAGVVQRDSFGPRDERRYPICDGWRDAFALHKRTRKHMVIVK